MKLPDKLIGRDILAKAPFLSDGEYHPARIEEIVFLGNDLQCHIRVRFKEVNKGYVYSTSSFGSTWKLDKSGGEKS